MIVVKNKICEEQNCSAFCIIFRNIPLTEWNWSDGDIKRFQSGDVPLGKVSPTLLSNKFVSSVKSRNCPHLQPPVAWLNVSGGIKVNLFMRGVNDLCIEGWPCDRLGFTHDMCSRTQDQRNAFLWRNVWQSSLLAHERKAQQRAHQGNEVDELFLRRTEVRLTRRLRVPRYTQGLEGSCSGAQLTGESVSSDVVNCCSYNGCELSGGNYWNPVASSHNSSRYVN